MVQVGESEHRRLVVNIVHVQVWVLGVVDHHRAAQAIAVLRRNVRVVPVRAGLVGGSEVVEEGVASGDGALVDKRCTVGPVGVLLE